MKKLSTLIAIILCCLHGFGQAGQPDPLFGQNGIVTADLGPIVVHKYSSIGDQVLPLTNGSMYVITENNGAGTSIGKRLPDGSADLSYGNSGFNPGLNLAEPHAVLQPDGKVLLAGRSLQGNYQTAIARYNTDGTLDNSFGGGLRTYDYGNGDYSAAKAIMLQNDGKIVVAADIGGGISFLLARYNADGSPDNSFAGGTRTIDFYANSIAIQTDGKIVVAGQKSGNDFVLARFNTDGNPDNTFAGTGELTIDFNAFGDVGYAVAIQNDGRIVIGGFAGSSTGYDFAIARYNPDGTPDNTFDNDGKVTTVFNLNSQVSSLYIEPGGKIIATGLVFSGFGQTAAIARYNVDGSLDKTFNGDGKLITTITPYQVIANPASVENDGKILVTGFEAIVSNFFTIGRYNIDGSPDNSFDGDGVVVDQVTSSSSTTQFTQSGIQPDGKVIAGGFAVDINSTSYQLSAWFNTDGTLDSIFPGFAPIPGRGPGSVVQPDGKIVSLNGFGFTRTNPDGTHDVSSQNVVIGNGATGNALAVQSNGKVVVAGYAYTTTVDPSQTYNSIQLAVARFNVDGTLDNSFGSGGIIVGYFTIAAYSNEMGTAVGVQSDGTIIVSVNEDYPIRNPDPDGPTEIKEVHLLRYNSYGIPANSIGYFPDAQNGGPIFIQDDDKILFGINGRLTRYNSDGSYDNTFHTAPIGQSTLRQTDGKILTGGGGLLARYNTDGTPDSSFGTNGQVPSINYFINEIRISGNKLTTAGYIQHGQTTSGVVGVYLLNNAPALTCPSSQTISTDKEKCAAVVNNIDPVTSGGNASVNYTLTGATVLSGAGSVSGFTFNKGITTVTYSLVSDPSVNCSFTVTVNDTEFPRISKVYALPYILWPANHKMRYVYLFYSTKDNCGEPACKVWVTSNQNISGDWEVINNHLIKLRAERNGGKERVYIVSVTCTDAAGNMTTKSVRIIVPKSRVNDNQNIKSEGGPQFEYAEGFDIKAYPNPSSNYFTLQVLSNNYTEKISLKVYDVSGRLVEVKNGMAPGKNIILGSSLHKGVYIAKIQQGKEIQHVKLLKTAGR